MNHARFIEFTFFYIALALVGYIVWQIFAPFVSALALSAIIVVVCYPLYEFLLRYIARSNRSFAALLTTIFVFCVIVTPIFFASSLLVNEFVSFYRSLDTSAQLPIDSALTGVETRLQTYIPGFDFNLSGQVKQSVSWFTENIGNIFAGTVSVIFTFLIGMLGSFYLFRDGKRLVTWFISVSPLKDTEDTEIFNRVSRSIRSVVLGTVLVAIIQGITASIGFSIFGIDRPVLWGSVAALGALLPGIGTAGIMLPAVAYLFYIGYIPGAIGLIIWAIATIVIVDNFVGPYLMSRGNNLHPFVVLVSVLGGISLFGPIGFILGPVFISLFMVLLELYGVYMNDDPTDNPKPIRRKKTT
jgi:predicted PurR-regulated permease PerM